MDKILSIIVPVYNQEPYLAKCLDSLLNQDLTNYEILAINDGSTDNSANILEKYALKYDNVMVVNQENKGLGGARNTGLSRARGKYVMFIDSDDYIEPNSLSILINKISADKSDILYANFIKVDTSGNIVAKQPQEQTTHYTTDIVDNVTFFSRHFGFVCYVCLFIFERNFLVENKFSFKEKIYMEDTEAIPRLLVQAKKISMLDYPFYNYVQTPTSIMRDSSKTEKRLKDTLYVTKLLREFQVQNIKDDGINDWFDKLNSINAVRLCSAVSKQGLNFYSKVVYKTLVSLDVFPLSTKIVPVSFSIMAYIINLNWNAAVALLSIINKLKICFC
ncbi:glycosyltransferase family 2 protein [Candidatus Symbiothrix dinenymphae]|uniref:glycosyltransferase family 2 protein n=1 Tax=Candidatus Symbiothrix dinenymphae TaxID=467085 RepID=UPI0006C4386B|nr:glycosyltransferase [Candidatus Symbiothrix dinenymphae]GAP72521.1 LPS biosynthesis glycosyltransferase [Candidatus Symbiothrix dinenymphae]